MTEYEQNIEVMKDLRNKIDAVLSTQAKDVTTIPDPKKHLYISLVKSFVRVGAGVALCIYGLPIAGGLLIAAEVLGVAEELV